MVRYAERLHNIAGIYGILVTDVIDMLVKQDWKCDNPYCELDLKIHDWTIDHKISKRNGGKNHIKNLHILCTECNQNKESMNWEPFLKILGETRTKATKYF